MANIILGCRTDPDKRGNPIITYSDSTHQALLDLGHTVTLLGEGNIYENFDDMSVSFLNQQSLLIDIDCGRNSKGEQPLHCHEKRAPIPSAVRLVDSHGNPSLHRRAAKNYDHVFFAVWDKRDIFTNHPSAHWCPNASDANYFIKPEPDVRVRPFDVGFFGSKGGLDRANILKEVCASHRWTHDIREMGRGGNRWPYTGEAMSQCKVLFNKGQKRDGPNQRVIESMLMERPLINDRDPRDGMSQLFEEGTHYLAYESASELANHIEWCLDETALAHSMAKRAYNLALSKHQVKHRVEQILEVVGVK